MKSTQIYHILLGICCLFFSSCVKDTLDDVPEESLTPDPIEEIETTPMSELEIPANFDFSVQQEVSLSITDVSSGIRYTLFANGIEILNAITVNERIDKNVVLPISLESVILKRSTGNAIQEYQVPVSNNSLSFEFN